MHTITRALLISSLVFLAACGSQKNSDLTANNTNSIFGGEELNPNEEIAGYIVGLYNHVGQYICTGSIIDEDMILTAAHCVKGDPRNLLVFFGPKLEKGVELRRVANAAVHARYRRGKSFSTGDIAVLKIEGDLPLGYGPIDLLQDRAEVAPGTEALFAGYGVSNVKTKDGSGTLRWVIGKVTQGFWSFTEASVKQSLKTGGVCNGDSGGPAMSLIDNNWVLWGVTSRGGSSDDGICTSETLFTRVDVYLPWIQKAVEVLRADGQ
jgi:secreted trypsin-like serine protease